MSSSTRYRRRVIPTPPVLDVPAIIAYAVANPLRCEGCGGRFPILVDDGPLCLRCDSLHYPEGFAS